MEKELFVDNHIFVSIFKEQLRDLEKWGFSVDCIYPKERSEDLVISYDGKFRIEIIRNSRADIEIFFSPNIGGTFSKKDRIAFYDIVFFLSNGADYIVPMFYGIYRYKPAYKLKISCICEKIFEYYNQIEEIMEKPNFQSVHEEIEKRVDILWSKMRDIYIYKN